MSGGVPRLRSMVGGEIRALVPMFHRTVLQSFILHGVEDAGIWVENQKIMSEKMLAKLGVTASPKSLIWFLPWHQITTIWGSIDVPGLSEKRLSL
jgi:hypothetical protein